MPDISFEPFPSELLSVQSPVGDAVIWCKVAPHILAPTKLMLRRRIATSYFGDLFLALDYMPKTGADGKEVTSSKLFRKIQRIDTLTGNDEEIKDKIINIHDSKEDWIRALLRAPSQKSVLAMWGDKKSGKARPKVANKLECRLSDYISVYNVVLQMIRIQRSEVKELFSIKRAKRLALINKLAGQRTGINALDKCINKHKPSGHLIFGMLHAIANRGVAGGSKRPGAAEVMEMRDNGYEYVRDGLHYGIVAQAVLRMPIKQAREPWLPSKTSNFIPNIFRLNGSCLKTPELTDEEIRKIRSDNEG